MASVALRNKTHLVIHLVTTHIAIRTNTTRITNNLNLEVVTEDHIPPQTHPQTTYIRDIRRVREQQPPKLSRTIAIISANNKSCKNNNNNNRNKNSSSLGIEKIVKILLRLVSKITLPITPTIIMNLEIRKDRIRMAKVFCVIYILIIFEYISKSFSYV